MTRRSKRRGGSTKEVRAWGIRREDVDVHQLALAYYLLARKRIEEQRRDAAGDDTASASDERAA